MKKILAFLCKICPFCIVGRMFPDTAYAKKLKSIEKNCPCCLAYEEVYNQK